ncbi:MAG TPA: exodeoxyribonuclease V subunit gamma [Marmoricola sp.]|nr:exodeoxyribonuclease V subunit gamma [Marmoricola sp.]
MTFRVHRAVRADQLVDGLAALLADPLPDPFARELVIVPARGVERWLSQRLSHRLGPTPGADDGVCAAVDFRSPQGLLAELVGTTEQDPWAPDALVWPVLRVIDASCGEPWAAVLATHLGHGRTGDEAELRRGRRYAVARRLAGLFAAYAGQRPQLLAEWEAGRATDGAGHDLPPDLAWQPELWRRVVAESGLPSPVRRHAGVVRALRDGALEPALPPRLSLFGHTTLSRTDAELLCALGDRRDVHLWLPHPSPSSWSARERSAGDQVERAGDNPLLVSLGRDVRELQDVLAAVGAVDEGALPPAPPTADTLLGRLQEDLVADRTPTPGPRDDTISVHACHGPARQVEVLRELLLGLLADDPTLQPRDIVVMCPDIEAYAPLITAAFGMGDAVAGGHPGQQLRVMLADRSPVQTNPLLGVLGAVLELADGRVEASRVLDLLATEPVRRRFGFGDADLETLGGWVARSGVRWGFDAAHRSPYRLEGYPQNTWRFGLDRILAGVALSDDSDLWLGQALPLDDVASSDIALAGRLAEALDRLQALTDGLRGVHPVSVWLERLRTGVQQLTAVPRGEEWQLAQLHRELARLGAADADAELRLSDVRALLHGQLAGRPSRASFRTGTLTVCTLTPMRSVPHRVVVLLGLDDHVFPRLRSRDGDDVLGRSRLPGERDPRSQDRQLFLDAVLAAGERLIITYTGFHESTGQPRPPSVPLREFLDVAEQTAGVTDLVTRHRSQAFHGDYLGGALGSDAGPFSFDPHAVAAARAAQGERVLAERLADVRLPPAPAADLELDALVEAVTFPVRAFVRRRLGVDLPREEEEVLDSLPVTIGGLDEWQVGDRILRELLSGRTLDHALQAEWRRGTLPPGSYGWRAAHRIADAVGPLAQLAETCTQGRDARSVDVDVALGDGRRLVGTVPGLYDDRLFRVGYSRLGAKQRLEAWVALVALAASGHRVSLAGVLGRAQEGGAPFRATYRPPEDALAVLHGLVAVHDEALCSPLPYGVETARAFLTTRSMRPWDARKELAKAWRNDCHGREFLLAWGERAAIPTYDALADDDRCERLARAIWQPALEREAE